MSADLLRDGRVHKEARWGFSLAAAEVETKENKAPRDWLVVGIEEGMGVTDVRFDEPDQLQSKIIFPALLLDCIRTILRN